MGVNPTIRELYKERRSEGEGSADLGGGWTIELHANGMTLCSPGTSAEELDYRDDAPHPIGDVLPPDYRWDKDRSEIIDRA